MAPKVAVKVPTATKLNALQETLNKNKSLRKAFIADPGAALRAQGVELGAAKEAQLAKHLASLTAPQRNTFEAQFLRIRIGVSIRIRIRVSIGITL
jgi:replicative superfamily II helicase